jgi:Periplasmic copper-binding protein (NosD)
MRSLPGSLVCALLGVVACSLQAPEDLVPVEGGGALSSAGTMNAPGGKNPSDGTQGGNAGADSVQAGGPDVTGMAGCTGDCSDGGAPPLGPACRASRIDCGDIAPICDAISSECRPCASDQECAEEVNRSYCLANGANAGRCATCKTGADCSGVTPICSNIGTCRGCDSDDECDSGVCDGSGSCALESSVVYALAGTGVSGAACGGIESPCRNLADAVALLSAIRRNLFLVRTTNKFSGTVTLPAIKGIRIIGNGVGLSPSDSGPVVVVAAKSAVTIDNVVIANSTKDGSGGIVCSDAAINVTNSTLQDNSSGIFATDCDVVVTTSLFEHNATTSTFNSGAIWSSCTTAHCGKVATILRNRFVDNGTAINVSYHLSANIENNLFLRNGGPQATLPLYLHADQIRVAYNTLVENFNDCTFSGIVHCVGVCAAVGNITFNNFPNGDCADQFWYGGGVALSYSLGELPFQGVGNLSGDPKFVDAAGGDFTPGPGSPAIDKGNPKDTPALDLNGNKRPSGAAPDIGAIEKQ